jgi:hypothetical protein
MYLKRHAKRYPFCVILNLFQDPFFRQSRSVVQERSRAAGLLAQSSVFAALWMLKRVQHDGSVLVRMGFALSPFGEKYAGLARRG